MLSIPLSEFYRSHQFVKPLFQSAVSNLEVFKSSTGALVAVKMATDSKSSVRLLANEIAIAQRLPPHPRLADYRSVIVDAHQHPVGLVTTLYDCDLFELTERRPLTVSEIGWIVKAVGEALLVLEEHGMIYTDIKEENIFLSVKDDQITDIRLGDLNSVYFADQFPCMTALLMAPECAFKELRFREKVMLRPFFGDEPTITPKVHVWGLGLLAFYLLYSGLPYETVDDLKAYDHILRTVKARQITCPSREGVDAQRLTTLLGTSLQLDPRGRPSTVEFLAEMEQIFSS